MIRNSQFIDHFIIENILGYLLNQMKKIEKMGLN